MERKHTQGTNIVILVSTYTYAKKENKAKCYVQSSQVQGSFIFFMILSVFQAVKFVFIKATFYKTI